MNTRLCFSALACALTVGLATGGHAQDIKSGTRQMSAANAPMNRAYPDGFNPMPPRLLTIHDVFHTVNRLHAPTQKCPTSVSNGFQSRAITAAPFYQSTGSGFYSSDHDALDDIYLPSGIGAGSGVTLTGFKVGGRNTASTTSTLYGLLTIYDKIDETQANTVAVTPLGSIAFTITGVAANSSYLFNIPSFSGGSPIVLTHDLSTTGGGVYGVSIGYYTDNTYKTLSTTGNVRFSYGFQPEIGFSNSFYYPDINNNGNYDAPVTVDSTKSGYEYSFGGAPYYPNIQLELDGTSNNNVTYLAMGSVTFQGLTSATPAPPLTFTLTSTTTPTAKPLVFTYTAFTVTPVNNARGITTAEMGNFFLSGIPLDNYNAVISSPGYTPMTVPITLSTTSTATPPVTTTSNAYGITATLIPVTGETVTGNIALEGVTDLSTTSAYAPLGSFTVGFYTPGSVVHGATPPTTPLYTQSVTLTATSGSPNGAYTVTGVPDGTYDVVIKGTKNLAVLTSSVVINSTSTVVPNVTLPAGDTNNDDSVDSTDFGNLIGAFNTTGAVTGSGYDPTVDLNFDGSVDSSDFGLLIGEFNNVGAL